MKRSSLAAVLICLCTLSLHSQSFVKHFTASAGAGFSFPVGTVADHVKTGFNFTASGGPRINRHFGVTMDFSLHYFNVKNALQTSGIDPTINFGSIMRMWSLTANPFFEFIKKERFSTYATGGYGLYNRELQLAGPDIVPIEGCDQFWNVCIIGPITNQTITGSLNTYKGGYNVGAGMTFGLRTKFFIETRYHHMFTTGAATEVIPLTFGVRW